MNVRVIVSNLITGWVNPGDVTALKHLLAEMAVDATVLFEIECFDSPLMPDGNHTSRGSTTVEELVGTVNAAGTIALNCYEGEKAARYQESRFGTGLDPGPFQGTVYLD
jgi:nitrogenase molybdenum-iron protein beta chain